MIQEEFWHARLAEASGLQAESSATLWGAFSTHLEQRLLAGSSLHFPGLGAWELEEHRELIAHTADGKYWLIPPRITLRLRSEAERSARSVSILLLCEILTQQTQLAPALVRRWLEQVCRLALDLLSQGASVSLPRLGSLTPVLDEGGHCTAYDFLAQESFVEQLNKPFSMFAPVEVGGDALPSDLLIEEVAHLAALYPNEPQRISLLSAPAEEAPLAPTPMEEEELLPPPPAPGVEVEAPPLPEPEVPAEQEEIIPLPSPSISEEEAPITPPSEKEATSPEEQPKTLFWALLGIGIALGLAVLYLLLGLQSGGEQPARPLLPETPDTVRIATSRPVDTLPKQDSVTAAPADTLALATLPPPPSRPAPASPKADVAEQVRLHAGDRLSRLALKKYGHKAFWVYIFEENRGKLKDPDNIPVGVVITLPPASKYHIDAQDTNSVNKALLLQRRLQQ